MADADGKVHLRMGVAALKELLTLNSTVSGEAWIEARPRSVRMFSVDPSHIAITTTTC